MNVEQTHYITKTNRLTTSIHLLIYCATVNEDHRFLTLYIYQLKSWNNLQSEQNKNYSDTDLSLNTSRSRLHLCVLEKGVHILYSILCIIFDMNIRMVVFKDYVFIYVRLYVCVHGDFECKYAS